MALSLSLRLACVALLVDGSAGLSLTLKYFDARGAAEISRVLLALVMLHRAVGTVHAHQTLRGLLSLVMRDRAIGLMPAHQPLGAHLRPAA